MNEAGVFVRFYLYPRQIVEILIRLKKRRNPPPPQRKKKKKKEEFSGMLEIVIKHISPTDDLKKQGCQ